jgi:hypothetical protein
MHSICSFILMTAAAAAAGNGNAALSYEQFPDIFVRSTACHGRQAGSQPVLSVLRQPVYSSKYYTYSYHHGLLTRRAKNGGHPPFTPYLINLSGSFLPFTVISSKLIGMYIRNTHKKNY